MMSRTGTADCSRRLNSRPQLFALIILISSISVHSAHPINCGCNPRDALLNYSFYPAASGGATWDQASVFCRSRGAWLPTIRSVDTNDALYNGAARVLPGGTCFWLGLSRRVADGSDGNKFRWVTGPSRCGQPGPLVFTGPTETTGSCVSFCNFPSGQPNNAPMEGEQPFVVVVMKVTSLNEQTKMWNDRGAAITCDVIACATCGASETVSVSASLLRRSATVTSQSEEVSFTSSESLTERRSTTGSVSVARSSLSRSTASFTWSSSPGHRSESTTLSIAWTVTNETRTASPSRSLGTLSPILSATQGLSRTNTRASLTTSKSQIHSSSADAWSGTGSHTVSSVSPSGFASSASAVSSNSLTFRLPQLLVAAQMLSHSAAAMATSAVSMSVAASAVAGTGSANDLQAVVVLGSAACWSHGNEVNYGAVTPFALSNTPAGALAGNGIATVTILLLQGCLALVVWLRSLQGVKSFTEAMSVARLPGFGITITASLHLSTLWVALKMIQAAETSGFGVAVAGSAILFCIAFPAAAVAAAFRVPRRFVMYDIADTSSLRKKCWLPIVMPRGILMPLGTRRMLSSVITAYQHPSPWCVLIPFMSSFAVNVVAVLPASTPTWMCKCFVICSAVLHAGLALGVVWFRVFVMPSSMVMACIGIMLTAVFHMLLGVGFEDGTNAVVALQAGLSIARSVVGVATILVDRAIRRDPDTSMGHVVWIVGNGGLEAGDAQADDAIGAESAAPMMLMSNDVAENCTAPDKYVELHSTVAIEPVEDDNEVLPVQPVERPLQDMFTLLPQPCLAPSSSDDEVCSGSFLSLSMVNPLEEFLHAASTSKKV